MADKEVFLTSEGLKKLEEELNRLKSTRRQEVADRIKQAIEFGDITDNSEYDDAKNEQAFIEGRIMALEKQLRNARVINAGAVPSETVELGSKVYLRDLDSGEELSYVIVGSVEADPAKLKISNESPVGKALMGQKKGTRVEVKVPAGTLQYELEDIQ